MTNQVSLDDNLPAHCENKQSVLSRFRLFIRVRTRSLQSETVITDAAGNCHSTVLMAPVINVYY